MPVETGGAQLHEGPAVGHLGIGTLAGTQHLGTAEAGDHDRLHQDNISLHSYAALSALQSVAVVRTTSMLTPVRPWAVMTAAGESSRLSYSGTGGPSRSHLTRRRSATRFWPRARRAVTVASSAGQRIQRPRGPTRQG